MNKRSRIIWSASCIFMVIFSFGPLPADDKARSSKPISQHNQSGNSSRWGDRLKQMQQSNGSSRSSSSSRSYQNSSRSDSDSTSYSRASRSSSTNRSPSVSSNRGSTSRNSAISVDRSRDSRRSSSVDRSRTPRSYTPGRGRSSGNINLSGSLNPVNPYQRNPAGSATIDRNSRNRTYTGSNNRDQRTRISGSDRSDRAPDGRYDRDRDDDRSSVRRGDNSRNRHDGGSYDRSGRHDDGKSWNRKSSRSQHPDSHGWNRDRKYGGSSYYNRYRYDLRRDKDFRHYSYDWRRKYYCPYESRFFSSRYYNRPFYSHSAFSTIIFGATLGYGSYSSYRNDGAFYQSSGEAYAEFYEHSGFRGEALQVFSGEAIYNLGDIRFDGYKSFNDRISSMRIFGEVTVVLYTESDLHGEYVYLTGSHIDFSRDPVLRRFQDEVSSIEVLPGIVSPSTHQSNVRQYETNEFLADVYLEPEPVDQVQEASAAVKPVSPLPPESARSARVPAPADTSRAPRVFLYDRPHFQGNQMVLNPGFTEPDLSRITIGLAGTWNDSVASIRIEGGAELMLYTDPDYLGEAVTVTEDIPNLSEDGALISFVNAVSSVIVNPPSQ